MKWTLGILLAVFIAHPLSAQNDSKTKKEDFDFRKTLWGMSLEEVKKVETDKIIKDSQDMLAYSTKVNGNPTLLGYVFVDNKLAKGAYVFNQTHSNKNDYIADFDALKSALMDKYGKPESDQANWENSLYKDDPEQWGFAVSLGHLAYYAQWNLPKTRITLVLKGENYETTLVIEYLSVAYSSLLKSKQKEEEKSAL